MSEGGFVRGFGDLGRGRGGLAWSLAGGGGLTLEGKRTALAEADAADGDGGGWRFETRLERDPTGEAATFRHLALQGRDGATIVCTAAGAPGIQGHGEERSSGTLFADGEEIDYAEALISTQYDGSGAPTRFGLELWPPDADQATRAAATRVSASLLGGTGSGPVWAGFFRCHVDGAEGLGTYLLWRA
jgi:hypothetical protein